MTNLTDTQKEALDLLKENFDANEPIGPIFNPKTGKNISNATMMSLAKAGYIEPYQTVVVKELDYNKFGKGYKGTKVKYEVSYKFTGL